jgi:hypothetical protein
LALLMVAVAAMWVLVSCAVQGEQPEEEPAEEVGVEERYPGLNLEPLG